MTGDSLFLVLDGCRAGILALQKTGKTQAKVKIQGTTRELQKHSKAFGKCTMTTVYATTETVPLCSGNLGHRKTTYEF